MANLLYIQASPRQERSKSNQVASAFLRHYAKVHPQDKIGTVNVFQEKLPTFDGLTVQAKYAILHGQPHTDAEQTAWSAVETVIRQFKQADKYVFSLPMWNFGIPYRLKHYIDIVVQPGYTFSAGPNGYEGLIRDKPAAVIYARGGAYRPGTDVQAFDLQKKYMDLILGFM
ncbi:MAG TPA: NAD(P)H-dependent oxidoreductase, partial [Anaerohalosphaeraceae bacterium]|nr:NAD(P)H-dependent oxidoreductase [Anaerohalosphaeraceae bacterium]